jgi:FAD binding domain/Berberine and berberine like
VAVVLQRREFCRTALVAGALSALPVIGTRSFGNESPAKAFSDTPGIKPSGAPTLIPAIAIKNLADHLRGRLITAGDPDYDGARRIWNRVIDRRPALIVQCQGAADITKAIGFARERELLVAVRGGGHSYPGYSTCDGGLVIDLSPMRGVRVDPFAGTARVAGGAWNGDLDSEAQQYGLATPMGRVPDTGVGGLTLGGGYGILSRLHGLACDNMIGADVITADGKLLHASAAENPDLLWALRGGGGNFGVVSSFEYQLHPVGPQILAGFLNYTPDQMRAVLERYVEVCEKAPRELDLVVGLYANANGMRRPFILFRYVGDLHSGEKILNSVRAGIKPQTDDVRAQDYLAVQQSNSGPHLSDEAEYAKSGHVLAITPELIEAVMQEQINIALALNGGAISDVEPTGSAVSHRRERFQMELEVNWKDMSQTEEKRAEVHAAWDRLERFTSGFYANLTVSDQKAIDDNYGPNRDRLARTKKQYDPDNFLRLNANIRPAS